MREHYGERLLLTVLVYIGKNWPSLLTGGVGYNVRHRYLTLTAR